MGFKMKTARKIYICDVSHRDGSYLNDFRVNARQTHEMVTCVDSAGVDYIEVGHGLGISAGEFHQPAKLTDDEYCHITTDSIKQAKWGMFCIAEKCAQKDVARILSYNPSFIKIGCEPDRFSHAEKILLQVAASANTQPILFLMKSYAWKLQSMLEAIAVSINSGVKIVYIVDSAGTMLGVEVAQLVNEFLEAFPGIAVGFHGHNNLGLAVSNSITAIENGATHVDCSMLGVGRSGGNCCIEQFVFILQRMNIPTRIDVFKLLKFANYKLPLIYPLQPIAPLDIIFGCSGFHSAFFNKVRAAAEEYNIDVNRLSYELGKITRIEPSVEELKIAVAASLEKEWVAV